MCCVIKDFIDCILVYWTWGLLNVFHQRRGTLCLISLPVSLLALMTQGIMCFALTFVSTETVTVMVWQMAAITSGSKVSVHTSVVARQPEGSHSLPYTLVCLDARHIIALPWHVQDMCSL